MENKIQQLTEILKESNNIVFFGGAGVSTASGIPDFRSSNGLWNEKVKINLRRSLSFHGIVVGK